MLAAAMDSRGYGRTGRSTAASRRATAGLMVAGMLGLCVGAYGLLDGRRRGPRRAGDRRRTAGVLCRTDARWAPCHSHPIPPRPLAGARMGGVGLRRRQRGAAVPGHRLQRRRPEPWLLSAAISATARRPGPGDPDRRDPGVRGPAAAESSRPPAARGRHAQAGKLAPRVADVIEFDRVTITYDGAPSRCSQTSPRDPRGRARASSSATGSASRRCSGAVNGLVPHFTGGALRAASRRRRDTASTRRASSPTSSASCGQDPLAGCVTDTVEEELAYVMEQLAIAARRDAQARRGDARPARSRRAAARAAASALGRPAAARGDRRRAHRAPARARARRADLRARPDRGRRGARGDHAARPRSRRHRRDGRAPARTRRAVRRPGRAPARRRHRRPTGPAEPVFATLAVAPPIVELGRPRAGTPLPLSVRDARRARGPLRERSAARSPARSPVRDDRRRRPALRSRAASSCATAHGRRGARASTSTSRPARSRH